MTVHSQDGQSGGYGLPDEPGSGHMCSHGSFESHRPGRDVICLDHVSYRYAEAGGDRGDGHGDDESSGYALYDVTLHIEQGCNLGIIGPNGAGKTTLLKIMLGMLDGYEGHVCVADMSPRAACSGGEIIGYVPQRHDVEWRFPVSVRQVVRMGLVGKTGLLRGYRRGDLEYVEQMMEQVGVRGLAEERFGRLSGGQQQRVFIARALSPRPRILILDEPLVGIDEAGQRRFASLIHELHETLGITVIIVSHDLQAVAAGCNRIACLRQRIHYHDSPAGLTPEILAQVFEHDIAAALPAGGA